MTGNGSPSKLWWVAVVLAILTVSACGGDDSDGDDASNDDPVVDDVSGTDDESDASAGTVDGAPPSGQATAMVDGLDLSFEMPGALACSISSDSLTYSYRIGDNEVTLGGGVNRVDGGWMGSIALTVADPEGEQGPIAYYPAPGDLGVLDASLFTIDGDTAKYSGPMLKQPANDGSQPAPVDVGTGTIIATC